MTEPTRVGGCCQRCWPRWWTGPAMGMSGGPSWSPRPATATTPDPHRPGRPDHRRGPHRVRLGAGAGRGAVEGLRHPPGAALPVLCATYRADAYQLLAAGLKGGKGVPESVAGHPGCW